MNIFFKEKSQNLSHSIIYIDKALSKENHKDGLQKNVLFCLKKNWKKRHFMDKDK